MNTFIKKIILLIKIWGPFSTGALGNHLACFYPRAGPVCVYIYM